MSGPFYLGIINNFGTSSHFLLDLKHILLLQENCEQIQTSILNIFQQTLLVW